MSEPAGAPHVVVLLGAGASALAGVPLTREFVATLGAAISKADASRKKPPKLRPVYDRLVTYLEKRRGSGAIDIELVYDTLLRVTSAAEDVLLQDRQDLPMQPEAARALKLAAEEHIRDRAFVDPQSVEYLDEIISLRANGPLEVFTTNYDTCVEVLCERHGLRWEDGFRVRWDPTVFDLPDVDVRLHKLHGSVLWYRDAQGGYLRSVLRPSRSDTEGQRWFAGTCEPLLIYPTRKTAHDAPYSHGLKRLADLLGDDSRQVQLLVIGYSFRSADTHIRQVVFDAARDNPRLAIALIDPCARQIYEDSLAEIKGSPSPAAGRVFRVCEGLDRDGLLLRDLMQYRLPQNRGACGHERDLRRALLRSDQDFRNAAHAFAYTGDRDGYARCIDAARARSDGWTAIDEIQRLGRVACLLLLDRVDSTRLRGAADDLCARLRRLIRPVSKIVVGSDVDNSSIHVILTEEDRGIVEALHDAHALAESMRKRSVGATVAKLAALRDWFADVTRIFDRPPGASEKERQINIPRLLELGVLDQRPSMSDVQDNATFRSRVDTSLDRFFAETAPGRLAAVAGR